MIELSIPCLFAHITPSDMAESISLELGRQWRSSPCNSPHHRSPRILAKAFRMWLHLVPYRSPSPVDVRLRIGTRKKG
jgi:hypothetical protein